MRTTYLILVAAVTSMLPGCSTPTTTVLPAVGPNPLGAVHAGPNGDLQVFAAPEGESDINTMQEEQNIGIPQYHHRTSYSIYDSRGKLVETLTDDLGSDFKRSPRRISLPAGTYSVKALMAVGFGQWVTLPVVIEAGRTTRVHLNGDWKPPGNTPANEIVQASDGISVGWRAVSPSGQ